MTGAMTTEKQPEVANIQDLRSMIQNEGEIHCRTDDWYLLRSLRCTQNVVSDAYQQLKHFWKLQQSRPDIFEGLRDPEFMNWLNQIKLASLLRNKLEDGSSVLLVRICRWDPLNIPFLYLERCFVLATLLAVMDPECQKNGIHWVVDSEGASWQMFRAAGLAGVKITAHYSEDCAPCFFKKLHVLNEGMVACFVLKLMSTFASKGLIKNHKCYGSNFEELHKVIPKEILPQEFGGLAGPMDSDALTRNAVFHI